MDWLHWLLSGFLGISVVFNVKLCFARDASRTSTKQENVRAKNVAGRDINTG
jgi:hypothetical protein